jgi:hypothetical protein
MITFFESALAQISVHKVGNKLQDEYLTLSENSLSISDEFLQNLLMHPLKRLTKYIVLCILVMI